MEPADELDECALALICRHGQRAVEIALRFSDAHVAFEEHGTAEFWAEVAGVARRKLSLRSYR